MDFSQMTQKWSARPKQERAARVRENQRRHRAKTKTYVAELENQVADLKTWLNEVLVHNAQLVSEVDKLRDLCGHGPKASGRNCADEQGHNENVVSLSQPSPALDPTAADPHTRASPSRIEKLPQSSPPMASERHITPNSPTAGTRAVVRLSPAARCTASQPPGTNERTQTPLVDLVDDLPSHLEPRASDEASDSISACISRISTLYNIDPASLRALCTHLPSPAPGESTIPCATAYCMINQQNYAGQDLITISRLLRPGFRRAMHEGDDDCRVVSSFVFSVIDDIS